MLVAHDRWFLEAVGTAVLELEGGRGRYFKGTWHAWRKEKAARELALGRAIERQEAEIAALERFVTRFRAGTRARQAQSRQKKLDKLDRVTRDPRDGKALGFAFKPPERTGRVVFEVEDGALRIGDRVLIDDFEFWLERGEHVTLVGANGTGKTTLINTLAGERGARRAASCGAATTSRSGCSASTPRSSARRGTVLEACQRATGLKPNETRALLGRFLFSGEEAEKPLDGLSGGERRRLSLAVLVQSGANVLILDEPTNHLDLESREALESALQEFPGALLLISHDRALLDAVGTRTIAIEDLHAALLRRRLAGVRARPRGARRGRARGEGARQGRAARPPGAAPRRPRRRRRTRSSGRATSRPRSSRPRPSWRRSSGSWRIRRRGTTRARREKSTRRHAEAKARIEALYAELEAVAS